MIGHRYRIRHPKRGLVFDLNLDYDDPVYVYGPLGPFTVDGIEYQPRLFDGRPMIEWFPDVMPGDEASTQFWSLSEPGEWIR